MSEPLNAENSSDCYRSMKVLKYIFQNVQNFSNIPEYGNDTLFQLSRISLPSRRAALGSLREQKRHHQQQQSQELSLRKTFHFSPS